MGGALSVAGNLGFGSTVRQMINLWGASYGIGVQGNTQYFRTDKNFAWYKGGAHNDGEFNAGASGTVQMVIKDGNVGIGAVDPGNYRLNVNGDMTASSILSKPQTFSFKVEGADTQYYPVVFSDNNWGDGAMILEIVRPNVHTDSSWKGALMSRFVCHSTNYGHGADFVRTEIYQSQTTFIAGYENERRTASLIVWLKGNTTYFWRANHFVTLSDFSAAAKTISGTAYPVKQAVESYVRSGSVNMHQGLQVVGTVTATKFVGEGAFVTGMILMWSGATNQLPTGWALCDGGNGTPDLRDRFIVGAGLGYGVGAKGGEATHTLTVNEMPSHTHNNGDFNRLLRVDGQYTVRDWDSTATEPNIMASSTIAYTGGGKAHENRPPYYALAYIM
ncbi:MAG: hypothetical protein KDE47_25910, partial [Caldilineaceae bacterium]|nr:hypothetical protein [Caldilineaceae bacterium]